MPYHTYLVLHIIYFLMFVLFFFAAMLMYRTCRCCRRIWSKLLHTTFHLLAAPCIAIAFVAVYVCVHHIFSRILNILFVIVFLKKKDSIFDKNYSYIGILWYSLILKWTKVVHPKYNKNLKKILTKAFWADKIGIQILILNFQVNLKCFITQKTWKVKIITHDLIFYCTQNQLCVPQ